MSWIHMELILPSSIWKLCFWQFWSPNLVDRRGGSNKVFPLSNGFCCFSISCFDKSVGTKWWWCSHLDHIGALPYFTEICGYEGPIYMTVSSKASSQWIVCWNSWDVKIHDLFLWGLSRLTYLPVHETFVPWWLCSQYLSSTFFWFFLQYPTKALAPLMLEDYRKVMVDRKGEQEQFSVLQIQQCMKRG